MWVFDFEVFIKDWMVVITNLWSDESHEFVNDVDGLRKFYEAHSSHLWIGFNNKRYDDYILKTILLGGDPKRTNDIIIEENDILKIFQMYNLYEIPLVSYDISQNEMSGSLKEFEGYLGLDIEESAIDFTIDRKLTQKEIEDVMKYCRHDVLSTKKLTHTRINNLKSRLQFVKHFGMNRDDIKKTDAQLVAELLKAKPPRQERYDELDPYVPPKELLLKDNKYLDFYTLQEHDYSKELKVDIAGVEHILKFGGLHGAIPNFKYNDEMWLLDVVSYYPSMMIEYDYLSRNVTGKNRRFFKEVYDTRMEMKHSGDKENAGIYKLILNITYGGMKAKFNKLYDPRMANNVCITGQLLLIDLIEKIEPYCKLVQSNTDGILVIPYDKEAIKLEVSKWEKRTRMNMEIVVANKLIQKDVNNYIMVANNGRVTLKGGMVYQANIDSDSNLNLRQSQAIVDDAVVQYFINDIPPEKTIYECNDLLRFQIITKTGKTFDSTVWHSKFGEIEINKVNRIYATIDKSHGKAQKVKYIDGEKRYHSLPNCPDHCYVSNDNSFNIKHLDKEFYIRKAKERIDHYIGG